MTDGPDIGQRLNEIREELARGLSELRGHLARVHKRRDLREETKWKHLEAVRRMGGRCPCCREVQIVDELGGKLPDLRWDHWKSIEVASIKSTWPVCWGCNCKLEDPEFRARRDVSFKSYQQLLHEALREERAS